MFVSTKKKTKSKTKNIKKYRYGKKNDEEDEDEDEYDLIETINNHIYFYSDVNNKTAFEITKAFKNVKLELQHIKNKFGITPAIHLHINSYGGCLFSAFCIIDEMRKIQNDGIEIYTYCEGKVASCGTLISIHGDKRFISKNAIMLIHQLSSIVVGKFSEIQDDFENCNMLMNKLKKMYLENANFKKKDLNNLLKHDLWLEADECLKNGLVDEII